MKIINTTKQTVRIPWVKQWEAGEVRDIKDKDMARFLLRCPSLEKKDTKKEKNVLKSRKENKTLDKKETVENKKEKSKKRSK